MRGLFFWLAVAEAVRGCAAFLGRREQDARSTAGGTPALLMRRVAGRTLAGVSGGGALVSPED